MENTYAGNTITPVILSMVAYATWGVFGIIGTVMGGWLMFGQIPGPFAWAGMGCMITGIILLH